MSAVGTSAIRILLRKIRLTLSSKHGVFATFEADPNPARKTRERVLTNKTKCKFFLANMAIFSKISIRRELGNLIKVRL